jgi:NADH:ubiquinone oxidoreductase subunit 2 (subunit N)
MDVYNDTPTIVTIWLTIMPKLSILILLLELYLQIDNIENYFVIFNPLIESTFNEPILWEAITSFVNNWGGLEFYEVNKKIGMPSLDTIVDEGVSIMLFEGINSLFEILIKVDYTSAIMPILQPFISWYVEMGAGSSALYNLLFVSSLLSLIIGTVLGLAQSQIKRLMAYSTIAHLGFLLLALSINTEEALDSFLFYILQYSITNLNVFLIIIAFNYLLCSLVKNNLIIKDIKYISELTNQYDKNPILTVSFIICLLSMAGIPPFIGFYSKLFVLFSAISISEYFIAIVAIIVSVISAYYYLRIIKVLYTDVTPALKKDESNSSVASAKSHSLNFANKRSATESVLILTNLHSLIIAVLSLFLVLFFLNPALILTSTRVLSLSLFNF